MRRTITSYFLIGTLAIGTSVARADEPASGMSRWLKNPFAKEAKETKADSAAKSGEATGRVPPVETTPTKTPAKSSTTKGTPNKPLPMRSADPTREAPRVAQPVSAPRRATATTARETPPPVVTNEAGPAPTPHAAARGSSAPKPSGLGLGLGKRQPSARAARGSLLDDDTPAVETETTGTSAAAATAPADPPRRRFIPLSRGHLVTRPQATPESEHAAPSPNESAEGPPEPPTEADAEAPVPVPRTTTTRIDRVPDPARVAPEGELDEVSVPAPVEQAEEAPKAPARAPKNSRRTATKRAGEPVPELQVDPGELNEVQILEAEPEPGTEGEEAAPPKAQAKPRTVEADAPAERPSLSQRFKGWWGVKK